MERPKFPTPRLIREDFLPEPDPMKNYRIKKTVNGWGREQYSPEYKRFGLFWVNLHRIRYGQLYAYSTYDEAADILRCHFKNKTKPKVEYLEVRLEDVVESKKEPNSPPKHP